MCGDLRLHIAVHLADGVASEIGLAVEQRERALFVRETRRAQVGGAADLPSPLPCPLGRFVRAVAQSDHHQRVGQAGHAEPDAPLGHGLLALLLQGEAGCVDRVVQHADRDRNQFGELGLVDKGVRGEGGAHQARQVDRAEEAGAVGRQRLFAAGIGRVDGLAVGEIVARVDAVNEDHTRLGVVVGRPGDRVEQRPGADRLIDLAAEG